MKTLQAKGTNPYPIHVGRGILERAPDLLQQALRRQVHRDGRVLIVTDRHVARYHLVPLASSLKRGGFDVQRLVFPAGERLKENQSLYKLLRAMVKRGFTRDSTVFALGGGVIGDFAGFASSAYMRGCHLVQVPTSLLAQVDSSIGGKVGINLPEGKNLVGSFHTPLFVLIDTDTLRTLPARELNAGFAEILKYGLIRERRLFEDLEDFFDSLKRLPGLKEIQAAVAGESGFLYDLVHRSARIKAEIVGADEHEQGLRMILNFGHTFGHAIEQATRYRRFLHGEAVFLGMNMATRLSEALGLIGRDPCARIFKLLGRFPAPRVKLPSVKRVLSAMGTDKKKRGGSIHYVVLERIGKAVMKTDIPDGLVVESIEKALSAAFPT
jgi:3-dehydroquinate synthase